MDQAVGWIWGMKLPNVLAGVGWMCECSPGCSFGNCVNFCNRLGSFIPDIQCYMAVVRKFTTCLYSMKRPLFPATETLTITIHHGSSLMQINEWIDFRMSWKRNLHEQNDHNREIKSNKRLEGAIVKLLIFPNPLLRCDVAIASTIRCALTIQMGIWLRYVNEPSLITLFKRYKRTHHSSGQSPHARFKWWPILSWCRSQQLIFSILSVTMEKSKPFHAV